MNMANISAKDKEAGEALFRLISGIGNQVIPNSSAEDDESVEDLDPSDASHQRRIGEALLSIIKRAPPSGLERVLGGMLFVILFEQNEIVDPDSDVLDIHPRFEKALDFYKKMVTGESDGDHPPVRGYDELWKWFGLSRATFCTLPRIFMHAMPDEWQRSMAVLMAEWDATWDSSNMPSPYVSAMGENNKFTRWPADLLNYRHPDSLFIDSMRKKPTE